MTSNYTGKLYIFDLHAPEEEELGHLHAGLGKDSESAFVDMAQRLAVGREERSGRKPSDYTHDEVFRILNASDNEPGDDIGLNERLRCARGYDADGIDPTSIISQTYITDITNKGSSIAGSIIEGVQVALDKVSEKTAIE